MRHALLFAAALAAAAPAAAQQPHPLTAREFLALERPGEPALSPDGRQVVYSVTTTDLDANRRRTDLWLRAADGSGAPRRLSSDSLGGRGARWSPDGRRLAFITARGGPPQVLVLDVATGRVRAVTSLSSGADGVLWSPDGRTLAFVSEVYPECRDDACNQRRADEDARRPSRARALDGLLYRHWNAWEDGLRSHLFVVDAEGAGPPRDLMAGRDWDTPVPPFGGSEQYAWSADSRTLAFTTKLPTRDQSWNTDLDVYTVPAAGGEPVLVTAGMSGADQNPAFSPDGRYLAFVSQRRAGFESDRLRLMVKDLRTGQVREVPRGWDDNILEYAWIPGGDLWAVTEKRQRHEILHIVFQSGDVHEVLTDMNPGQLSFAGTAAAPILAFVSDAIDRPPDVYVWAVDHDRPRPPLNVSRLNAAVLPQLAMNPARAFSWMGAAGDSAHGLLLLPPGFDPARRYPALILIHGGPQGAWLDQFHSRWNAQMFAAPGYVVAMINPHGSTGFGQAYVDAVSRNWGSLPYEDIMRGTDAVARLPFVDSTRMGAAGGSYGGYMVNWIAGHTDRFQALVTHSGVFNLEAMAGATEELWFTDWEFGGPYWLDRGDYERFSPHRFVRSFRTPTLVIHGALDYRVPETEGMQMFTALQRQNVPSRFLYFPDEGHWIGKPQNQLVWWNEVQAWLGRYLLRPAS